MNGNIEDDKIEEYIRNNPDFQYDNREKVLSRTSHIDLIKARRRNLLISLVAPSLYMAFKKKFTPLTFVAASFLTFSALNYSNEKNHDMITRELNIRVSEQINKMMDLD